jgi:chromosome segregation ATPase
MMDINQAARMIEWLDEERRRDKSTIATMEERLAQQQDVIDTLNRRLNSIESDQTVMRSVYVSNDQGGELQDNIRKEIRQLLESTEAKRLTAEREQERRSEIARENTLKPIRELTERLSKLERQLTELPSWQAERDRQANQLGILQQRVDDFAKRAEEPERRLVYLEEQRRESARRTSEIESEIPEVKKQIDSVRPKLTLLEDLALRNERRVQEVQNKENERREQIQAFIDQQTLNNQQRDRQIEEMVRRFGEQDGAMQKNIDTFERWADAYRQMKKIIDDFERIGDRLERRINEVAEMQRLSEERFRAEWNDWRSEDQKRWKNFTISNDDVWRSHDKEFGRFIEHIDQIAAQFPPLQDQITRLWNLERARAQLYRERYQDLLREHDSITGATTTGTFPAVSTNGSNGASGSER